MGFCIFGIAGYCGTTTESKKSVDNQIKQVTEVITEKYYKAMTEMKASTSNIQSINVKSATGSVIITDVNMLQNINLTSEMIAKLNNTYDVNAFVDDVIDTAAKANLNVSDSSMLQSQSTLTVTQYNFVSDIKKELKNMIKKEDLVTCASNMINSQTIAVEAQGDVTIRSINMTITASMIAKCMLNTVMNYVDKIKVDDKIIAKLESEETIESESTLFYIIIAIILGILASIGYIIYNLFRK
jgi:hypothetical protein